MTFLLQNITKMAMNLTSLNTQKGKISYDDSV